MFTVQTQRGEHNHLDLKKKRFFFDVLGSIKGYFMREQLAQLQDISQGNNVIEL